MEPFVVPIVVYVVRQIIEVSQMTSPQDRQLKDQKHEVPQMTSP